MRSSDLVCDTCNIKFLLFIHLPCARHIYNEATNVLYTARLVSKAFCIQPMVK